MKKRPTVMRSVARARRAWNDYMKQITLAEGLPNAYRQVIMFLYHNPGGSQRNVAEFADITASAVNQTVKNMLAEEYLRKETDPTDKRNSRLYLTEKGEGIALRLRHKLDNADDAITAFLGKEKEEETIRLMQRLTEFIREELKEC